VVSSFISDEVCGLVDIGLRDWRKTLNMGLLFTDPHYITGPVFKFGHTFIIFTLLSAVVKVLC
jgi:hypothetical protein